MRKFTVAMHISHRAMDRLGVLDCRALLVDSVLTIFPGCRRAFYIGV